MTQIKFKAYGVHILTATGAVFAMLAMLAATQGAWDTMYLWLLVAFVVDGIDGPLARKYDVKTNAARFDGALLDLIIDYLTYVFIPAYALFASGIVEDWMAWAVLIIITFASALYFCDDNMKTADYSFSGFPGCWNMLVLVFFAAEPPSWIMLVLVVFFALGMFLPLRFIHPTRTKRWRRMSLPIALVWSLTAMIAAFWSFEPPIWVSTVLMLTSVYLAFAGIAQQIIPERKAHAA